SRQHHIRGVSRRAPDRLPQSRSYCRTPAQARGSVGCDRTRAHPDPTGRSPRQKTSARRGADRPQGRRRDRQIQDGQTLHARHHRHDFSFARKQHAVDAEARLDGIYVVRTSLPAKALDDSASVRAYKSLAQVERAIRSIKTVDLQVRPVFHWLAPRVRAHVCLCMLAYYLEWHMRQRLAPMLYDDADKQAAEALRTSIVAKAQRSASAIDKQTRGTTPDGLPVHSFQTLLADLATLARNTVTTAHNTGHEFVLITTPTAIQQKALDLLGIKSLHRTQ